MIIWVDGKEKSTVLHTLDRRFETPASGIMLLALLGID
jgi:hypothetical protein